VVLEPWQLARNPNLAFAQTVQEASKVEAAAAVHPISGASVTADFIPNLMAAPHTGTFTSACAVFVYGGVALSEAYRGNAFVCEPAQNLVQRQIFRAEGASFRADAAPGAREFLASTDTWFRPVWLAGGPDGALYVADMHRREIDHPVYVPEEARGLLDFESGKGAGRIYRIVSANAPRAAKRVFPVTPTALVAELDSMEAWRRDTAFRLLLEKHELAQTAALERAITTAARPEARVRALALLHAGGNLPEKELLAALGDPSPGVRENAVSIAAERQQKSAALRERMLALAGDADARVRFACALALATDDDARAVGALATIAARDAADRWTRAAVLSGVGGRIDAFSAALQTQKSDDAVGRAALQQDVGRLIGTGAAMEAGWQFLREAVLSDSDLGVRIAALVGLSDGWQTRSVTKGKDRESLEAAMARETDGKVKTAIADFLARTAKLAAEPGAPVASRATAVTLLGTFGVMRFAETFRALLDPRQPAELQQAVVRALERAGNTASGALLLDPKNWARYSPQMRAAVIVAVTGKAPLLDALFDAIERGTLRPTDVPPQKRTQLMKHTTPAIRERAEKAFKALESGDRMAVYRAHRDVLALPADATKGREVFLRICSACHTRGGIGGKVGPDLTGIRRQPADALLLHILVPNYEVAPQYQAVNVDTRDGRSLTGWVSAETDSALTLRTAAGADEVVLRSTITSLTSSGLSLMPDGLEQAMTREELASLIAFLKSDN
jgi:putative heme-binding domain-containing protein